MTKTRNWMSGAVRAALLIPLLMSGCILRRGDDFGSSFGRAEDIPVIRIYNVEADAWPSAEQTLLVLPPLGESKNFQIALQRDLQEELQKYLNARVITITPDGKMADYVTEANLAPEKGFFDFAEVTRLGQLMQTDYVICTWIQELRPYPPQVLSLYVALLDVKKGILIAELDATFNASEQKVVVALQNYLQRRRARKFNKNNLDVMLQSPAEFHLFAMAECCRALALELAPPKEVKY